MGYNETEINPFRDMKTDKQYYVECELEDVLIGAPILVAKQGTRTSNRYATFPNDYEGEEVYLKPITIPSEGITENVKIHLTLFLGFLLKEGYCDSDVYAEPPTAIDQYINLFRKEG